MSSVVIAGDTSGTITLQAPAVAGSTTLTLPATSGTVLTSTSAIPTSSITGVLSVAQGGTGISTAAAAVASTGTGNAVLSNNATLVAPALGTPASGNLSNCTGYPVVAGELGVGVSQTWQDVGASRALGTTYTNTTGRPIAVSIGIGVAANFAVIQLTIGGVIAARYAQYSGTQQCFGIVPPGATYVTNTASLSKYSWSELR